jgi:hypothetical protein
MKVSIQLLAPTDLHREETLPIAWWELLDGPSAALDILERGKVF